MTPLFVMGLLFSPDATSVALVRKADDPREKLAGLWTGIGGAVEDGETPLHAMEREFLEEAFVAGIAWRRFAELVYRGRTTICFTARDAAIERVGHPLPNPREPVARVLVPDAVRMGVPNLRWLIPMALDRHVAVAVVNHSAEEAARAA